MSRVLAPTIVPGSTPAVPYGSCQCDSRNNWPIGWTDNAELAYKFRASTTSYATSLRLQQKGSAPYYSQGDGGTIRVTIREDNGGLPTGAVLATVDLPPYNPPGIWEVFTEMFFAPPALLTVGTIYWVRLVNVSAAPATNFRSLNDVFYYGTPTTPRQPVWPDADYAVYYKQTGGWSLKPNDTPSMDLAYADGTHDGMNYIGAMLPFTGGSTLFGSIGGSSGVNKVREHFTVSGGSRTVTSANVKVKRLSGTGDLTIRLETGAGTEIESVVIASSLIALGDPPIEDTEAAIGGNTWAEATFLSSHVLANGSTYNLVLSAPAGTEYVAVPVQQGTTKGMLSKCFTDGIGQLTTDGGSTWLYIYPYLDNGLQNLQLYFEVTT